MIANLRAAFNERYQAEHYRQLLRALDACTRTHIGFRVAETPVFFPKDLLETMAGTGAELTHRLVRDRHYLQRSAAAIPEAWRAADETPHPHFMTVDFGLVREADGSFSPRLVELQGFPSVYGFQSVLNEMYRSIYALDELGKLAFFLGGHSEASFWKLMGRVVLNGHDPENVVLAEIQPMEQKTLPDFRVTADRLGIPIVDIAEIVPQDRPGKLPRLCYREGKRLVPIHRIYNRTIVDELIQKQIRLGFDYRESFDVEWAGHPNWYFHLSKFSLPFLNHPNVPPAVFLDDWFAGRGADRLSPEREHWVLKPLFSFAGKGIIFAPTEEQLAAIPVAERKNYLLQERVSFERVVDTPFGWTQPEIRILYLWPDGGELQPVFSLVRLGRGQMMGVDHNRNLEWVGASAAFFPA
ncbi:hypothetical protein [Silvibacterium dinghuense]|uniref:Circularly permuted type 2 ATP-grasp protein n=1 Tax=Silvibacterium dinghuense TaxID=1560006 RepID=A0A4Q1SFJ0_9BACT|nr:hypothetical protein [Silvibacterium dinghuense]RXS95638.1 hypothetical protein ESZ00_13850 [Silvibacterium dinghuense]GGH14597.1 hypothetical protein GCM10011586_35140 [Silvibacterium dinghuense]